MEQRIEQLMKSLDISRDEAMELIADDKKVDKMTKNSEINSDLTAEQQKNIKKMKNTGVKTVNAYGKTAKVVRKPNDDKRFLINLLENLLKDTENVENLEVTNIERQIDFIYKGKKKRIVLSEPRK